MSTTTNNAGPWNIPNSKSISLNSFNLTHERKMSGQLGKLYPATLIDAIPGDVFNLDLAALVRFQPMVAPVMNAIQVKTYAFFVPYRLLWPMLESDDGDWETFITRGESGTELLTPPIWTPAAPTEVDRGTLWDYLGFPIEIVPPTEACPLDFPRRAYNFIWNEYFRDEDLQNEVSVENTDILRINWDRDYFLTARPWQQRGSAPAFPLQSVVAAFPWTSGAGGNFFAFPGVKYGSSAWPTYQGGFGIGATQQAPQTIQYTGAAAQQDNLDAEWSAAFEATSAADINDLRYMVQLQVLQELLARSGVRYNEFLKAVYGVAPTDARLQRPELIGTTIDDVMVSEVLQTAEGTAPVGSMAGHGVSGQAKSLGRYSVQEHGIIMILTTVVPKSSYQDGIQRWLLKRNFADFYMPDFAGLSEQEVFNAEICTLPATEDPDGSINRDVFGFQGRYDEYRSIQPSIAGEFRDLFDYWHFSRQFTPTAAARPVLNSNFIACQPRLDPFAVQTGDHLLMALGFHIRALRPLPPRGIPASLFTRGV